MCQYASSRFSTMHKDPEWMARQAGKTVTYRTGSGSRKWYK